MGDDQVRSGRARAGGALRADRAPDRRRRRRPDRRRDRDRCRGRGDQAFPRARRPGLCPLAPGGEALGHPLGPARGGRRAAGRRAVDRARPPGPRRQGRPVPRSRRTTRAGAAAGLLHRRRPARPARCSAPSGWPPARPTPSPRSAKSPTSSRAPRAAAAPSARSSRSSSSRRGNGIDRSEFGPVINVTRLKPPVPGRARLRPQPDSLGPGRELRPRRSTPGVEASK